MQFKQSVQKHKCYVKNVAYYKNANAVYDASPFLLHFNKMQLNGISWFKYALFQKCFVIVFFIFIAEMKKATAFQKWSSFYWCTLLITCQQLV